jgi:hypothetical protein
MKPGDAKRLENQARAPSRHRRQEKSRLLSGAGIPPLSILSQRSPIFQRFPPAWDAGSLKEK